MPTGPPNEKTYVPRSIWAGSANSEWAHLLLEEGVEPGLARALAAAFADASEQALLDDEANLLTAQQWANIHTHEGSGSAAPLIPPPDDIGTQVTTTSAAIGSSVTTNVAVHTAVEEGDMLIGVFCGHVHTGNAEGPYTGSTLPAGWNLLHDWGVVAHGRAAIMWKWADANDAAGTVTYPFTTTSSGDANHTHRSVVSAYRTGFGPAGGTPFGTVEAWAQTKSNTAVLTKSLLAPATDGWILAVGSGWTSASTTTDQSISLTNPPTDTYFYTGFDSSRSPVHAIGHASGGDLVEGVYGTALATAMLAGIVVGDSSLL